MSDLTTIPSPTARRPVVTLMMILCGVVGGAAASTVGAATPEDLAPSIVVKYDPQSLATDAGARAVYHRLTRAAYEVCPDVPTGSRFVTNDAAVCRRQAVAHAVRQIDNPRLAALDAFRAQRG